MASAYLLALSNRFTACDVCDLSYTASSGAASLALSQMASFSTDGFWPKRSFRQSFPEAWTPLAHPLRHETPPIGIKPRVRLHSRSVNTTDRYDTGPL